MATKTIPALGGALLGIGPSVFLAGAVADTTLFITGGLMICTGFLVWVGHHNDNHARDLALGIAGLSGGIAMAVLNLMYPVATQAFPGGSGVTWIAAMLMFGGATPILHPIHKEHASLRAMARDAGLLHIDAESPDGG